MNFTKAIETAFKRFLPSPFTIAILLTLATILLAFFFTENTQDGNHVLNILSYWEAGIWNNALLVFAYQMMLILVLGHVLVLSKPMSNLIGSLTKHANSTTSAVVLVSVSTMLVSFFNWGLGLIFGAIMARKVAESAQQNNFSINYPLVGASGYVGLMIWHGGISGSAPLKVAESGHLASLFPENGNPELLAQLPDLIATSSTIFSWWNLVLFGILLILIPLLLYYLAKRCKPTPINFQLIKPPETTSEKPTGADRLDFSKWLAIIFGSVILIAFVVQYYEQLISFILTPNMLNFFMLGLAIILHGSFKNFLNAVEEAISGASGILIQFPLYFGIIGIMSSTGMVTDISSFFVSIANETTLPIYTFFSAGLVNIFVPSGGGQWAIQGPVIVDAAHQLGVPLNKMIMALAYGDQITNMLQPFWALPLLGITKLKAKEILPYTVMMMFVGVAVYVIGLLLI